MNVRLHIDRLVLEGIDAPHPAALRAAVERELAAAIAARGLGTLTPAAVPHVRAHGEIATNDLAPGIARAVVGAVGGGR